MQVRDELRLVVREARVPEAAQAAFVHGVEQGAEGHVAAGMRLAVTEAQQALLSQSRTVHPEAYEAYLRGSYFVGNRWMAGGCRDAERHLLRAIELAPEFAPPYATLAWCYAYPDRIGRSIEDIGPKAKAAVKTALALDDSLALAHLVLGTILRRVEYDPAAAEAELRRALELDSSSGLGPRPGKRRQSLGGLPTSVFVNHGCGPAPATSRTAGY